VAHDPYFDLIGEMPEPEFDPARTALLVIDLQHLDAHPEGWMGRLARDQGKPDHLKERFDFVAEIVPNVQRMLKTCRAVGVQVFHVRLSFRRYLTKDGVKAKVTRQDKTPLVARDYDLLDEVSAEGSDIILDKESASTFNSTAIDQMLRNMKIDRLWVSGIVTEGCVELTARDALDRGYAVALVTDCCASSTHVAHYDALQRMNDGGQIKLHTSEELVGWMEPHLHKAVPA
jgi:nicotinamidase-related amidase